MKILVNGTPLLAPLTGIGQYIRHLFTAMGELPDAQLHVCRGLRCEPGIRLPSRAAVRSMQGAYGLARRLLPNPRAVKSLIEAAAFRYHARRLPVDCLYHEPNFLPQPFDGPTVVTVCDLSCFDHPGSHPVERVRILERDLPGALQRADHIIVISAASGQALRRWFDVDLARITTTYLAADPRFRPRGAAMLIPALAPLGLTPGGYVLCVGTLEPRKNLTTLFAAYAGLPTALRQRYPLIVAGMSGWNTGDLMKSARELIGRGELRLLGYVADELMPSLYAGAAAFAYPSRYEGFGLPALEAMASGVPVITGNLTALPEVVGDVGIMVDPDDVDGMGEGLRQLLEDRDYADNLVRLGLARAQTFSWNRCARETFAVYEKVMRQRGYP
ncbi:MAG: glycosyltransferase family 1 protein [Gammaproteobacteria bacterium]|nr:glycosyltransferase family 1 protein [Gammaproteobacteria bacterium]